jgi:hypothetical protein
VLIYIATNFLAPIPLISAGIDDFIFQFVPNRRTARAEISRKSANRLKSALRPAKAGPCRSTPLASHRSAPLLLLAHHRRPRPRSASMQQLRLSVPQLAPACIDPHHRTVCLLLRLRARPTPAHSSPAPATQPPARSSIARARLPPPPCALVLHPPAHSPRPPTSSSPVAHYHLPPQPHLAPLAPPPRSSSRIVSAPAPAQHRLPPTSTPTTHAPQLRHARTPLASNTNATSTPAQFCAVGRRPPCLPRLIHHALPKTRNSWP